MAIKAKDFELYTQAGRVLPERSKQISSASIAKEPLENLDLQFSAHKRETAECEMSYIDQYDVNVLKKEYSLKHVSSTSKKILYYLYKNMKKNNGLTEELTLDLISVSSGVNKKSLKNLLFRLTHAGIIERYLHKKGRGGWVIYKISEEIYRELESSYQ